MQDLSLDENFNLLLSSNADAPANSPALSLYSWRIASTFKFNSWCDPFFV